MDSPAHEANRGLWAGCRNPTQAESRCFVCGTRDHFSRYLDFLAAFVFEPPIAFVPERGSTHLLLRNARSRSRQGACVFGQGFGVVLALGSSHRY